MAEDSVTIVVVDDDDGHVELVRRNLRRSGINNPFEAIQSGEGALDYVFQRGAYARRVPAHILMVLDINMSGGVDGIEVLRQIKADPITRRTPVIMLTTADDPRDVDRCYDLGCNVYMTKPVDPVTFGHVIERLGSILSVARLPSGARVSA